MRTSRHSPMWLGLILVPWVLAALLLAPSERLSTWGEGLLPEWLGVHLIGTPEYQDFARALLQWTVLTLILAAIIAVVIWYLLERAWPDRLRQFDVRSVLGYQGMVVSRLLAAFVAGLIVGVAAAVISPEIRGMPVVSTLSFIVVVGSFAALQFVTAVVGLESTHRLFFGR